MQALKLKETEFYPCWVHVRAWSQPEGLHDIHFYFHVLFFFGEFHKTTAKTSKKPKA